MQKRDFKPPLLNNMTFVDKRHHKKVTSIYNLLATEISSIRLLKQHCQTASEAYAYKLQGIDDCL
jgi:hypothetical protein